MVDRPVRKSAAGFTFIEVLSCLLVLSGGVAGAISLTYYALVMGARAQGKATGMATAMTVAIDPGPLMHAKASSQWQNGGTVGTSSGWINGFYVVRVETAGSQPAPGFANNAVSVDVYDGTRGTRITSYTTWVMRQAFSP